MDIENLPSPISDVSYNITSFEYLGNLKVIELLWILCPKQREVAYGSIVFKTHFLKAQSDKDPSLDKELGTKMKEWATSYMKNDKAIWYYLEQSYDLTVNDFIKGFPNVMNVLKKEETFINHTTNEQKQFLDTVLNSTLCKIIGAGNTPSSWNWIMLLVQLSLDSKINSSNRATWIGMKMVKLSIRMISQPKKQNEALELFQQYFDVLFGDYMLEVNRHYLFNYFYYRGDFKDMFQSNQEDKSEKQEIENNSKELPKIEWQGTQKELAELFVELHKNGWITTIPTKLIKRYFTNSNSIEQVLKPTHDSRTKVKTYEGIYTSKYSPRFDEIRQNS